MIVSAQPRVTNKPAVEILLCSLQRSQRSAGPNEVLLDREDGLNCVSSKGRLATTQMYSAVPAGLERLSIVLPKLKHWAILLPPFGRPSTREKKQSGDCQGPSKSSKSGGIGPDGLRRPRLRFYRASPRVFNQRRNAPDLRQRLRVRGPLPQRKAAILVNLFSPFAAATSTEDLLKSSFESL